MSEVPFAVPLTLGDSVIVTEVGAAAPLQMWTVSRVRFESVVEPSVILKLTESPVSLAPRAAKRNEVQFVDWGASESVTVADEMVATFAFLTKALVAI